ncbi:AAA family ATPase [Corynebacterium flavescens]|uniref:AAA family ATPase n=1 Tax=Corynebacterium flavescens TaxID=28028 RepID=UPI002649305C|nr:AAA family ATPase [Corynebacterium flavescens]MDN6099815.1 AAA family ATPase [Corynebacterium flavescens]MDN6199468.1 AAA family ATPase [Corynebacterium flavescens]MDN6225718.1 AAA family ATPase [Corynebacterium flavescens]MDN6235597.1 AAA family ATPase [Corynebacterium flavescens]MDN6431040.1 AAA family ATPase [Corynebacterium flavescens]
MLVENFYLDGTPTEEFLLDLPCVSYLVDLPHFALRQPVTCFVGDNGIGKSTLLEAIALNLEFDARGGRIADPARVNRDSPLARNLRCTVKENLQRGYFLRAETHSELLEAGSTEEERGGRSRLDPNIDLHSRSHGESLFDVIEEHVSGTGIYIFDEPEAGLSVVRQMALIAEIYQAVERGGQFIIATHSPILLGYPGADIVELNSLGFERIDFDSAEAVAATREFLEDPRGSVDYILHG